MTLIIENQSFVEPTVMEYKICPNCRQATLIKLEKELLYEFDDVDPEKQELWFCADDICEVVDTRPIPRRAIV